MAEEVALMIGSGFGTTSAFRLFDVNTSVFLICATHTTEFLQDLLHDLIQQQLS